MTRSPIALLVALTATLAGCSDDPIVGLWQSDAEVADGRRNQLAINEDNTGEAAIWVTSKTDLQTWTKFEFDVKWEAEDDEFDVALDCDGDNCYDDDLVMTCMVISEGDKYIDKMDCSSNASKWRDYPFDWERVE